MTSPSPVLPRGRTPAVVVVDSRNVRGQIQDLFGQGRQVDVAGVKAMLDDFGFDVTDVYVGVATMGDERRGSSRLQGSLAQNRAFAEQIVSNPHGHVLEGRLVERGAGSNKAMEEKLVDVLCAMQIARTAHEIAAKRRDGVIVVLSEDMDLIPAYEFARDLGVRVFAASNDRVDTRAQHSGWLLLPEGSLQLAAGSFFGNKRGTDLRRFIVNLLEADESPRLRVKVGYHDSKTQRVSAKHNSGLGVSWTEPSGSKTLRRGDVTEVNVAGCLLHPGPFPEVMASREAATDWPEESLERGTVMDHRTATRVSVRLEDGTTRTLDVPAGTLLPGMTVLVQAAVVEEQMAWRYVGPCVARPSTPGWADSTRPILVRATSSASTAGARVRAVVAGTVDPVTFQPPAVDLVRAGQVYAAVPSAHIVAGDELHVLAMAVSSRLG